MIDTFDVAALGARVRLSFDERLASETTDALREAWADASLPQPGEPDAIVQVTSNSDARPEPFADEVTLAALKQRRGALLMLRAAGVTDREGRVAALIGGSRRERGALSRALGRHFGYVTDEVVGAAPNGRVAPYRKPLSVSPDASAEQVAASAIGMLAPGRAALKLSAITLMQPDADAIVPRIEAVSFCDAVADVLPHTSYFAELPTPLQTLAHLVDHLGGFTRVRYADAESLVSLLPELLVHRGHVELWDPVLPSKATLLGGRYTASRVIDALRFEDGTAVFTPGRIQVLGGIAPAVWDALCAERDFDGIVRAVVDEFGAPPNGDPHTLVQGTIDELVVEGVLSLA